MRVDPLFHRDMWNNVFGLQRIMKGKDARLRISQDAQSPPFITQEIRPGKIGGLEVFLVSTKAPFQHIFALFLRTVSLTLSWIRCEGFSRRLIVLSQQMEKDWIHLANRQRHTPIVPSYCHHQLNGWDAYGAGDILANSIEDPSIKRATFFHGKRTAAIYKACSRFHQTAQKVMNQQPFLYRIWHRLKQPSLKRFSLLFVEEYGKSPRKAFDSLFHSFPKTLIREPLNQLYTELKRIDHASIQAHNHISLFFENNLSRGGSLWFIKLFFKTRHLFKSPDHHLFSIAKEFQSGIPKQGAIAQALWRPEPLMKLKNPGAPKGQISLYDFDHDHKNGQKLITDLPQGVYRVDINQDSLVYLKLSDSQEYVWNPYLGLFKMNAEGLFNMLLEHRNSSRDPLSTALFYSYESMQKTEKEAS